MAYDEEQRRRSRVVVETPAARREVVETQVARVPERRGMSTGAVAALVVGAVALVTILFLFLLNRQQADNINDRVTTAPPVPQQTIIQQPVPVQPQQQPVIVQQPPATTTQPIVVTPPTTSTTTSSSTTTTADTDSTKGGTDDATVQASVDKKISDDPDLAALGVIATVADGRVTLTGTVDTMEQKRSIERAVRSVKGVKGVDDRITVNGAAAPSTSP
jgi:hypothetical protein